MRIVVVGANGKLGQEVVARALATGHEVTAFVRRQGALPSRPKLSIVLGDVAEDPKRVENTVQGHDAVISALGNPLWIAGKRGPAIMTPALGNVVAAMQESGVPRLAVPLSWGSGASRRVASPFVRAVAATLIRRDFADFSRAEALVVGSGLEWTVAYFGRLTDAPAGPHWTASSSLRTPANLAISRADVAQFLVSSVAEGRFVRQRAVLSGPVPSRAPAARWERL